MSEQVHSPGESDRAIVFVHGRGFKPNPKDYLDVMVEALTAGVEADCPEAGEVLADTTKYLAYYGDLNTAYLESLGEVYDEKIDLSDLSNVIHELKGVDRRKGFSVRRYDRLPGKSAIREFAISVMAPFMTSMGFGKRLIHGANTDFGRYMTRDSELSVAVLARVRETIAAVLQRFDRVTVFAHGTGSVVACDALWQLSHGEEFAREFADLKVDIFLTTGSPLGDSTVRQNLLGGKRKGRERYPTNVLAWHNVSAEDDYVAYDNTVADDFKAMLAKRQISSIRDYRIYNLAVRYGRSNPHNMLGYLIHPRVAKVTTDWLAKASGRALQGNSS